MIWICWCKSNPCAQYCLHDDVIIWKHCPRYWPFVRDIHRPPVNSPHIGQWRGALVFILICSWINGWVNNREAGDLRRHRARYDVIVMCIMFNCNILAWRGWVSLFDVVTSCVNVHCVCYVDNKISYCVIASYCMLCYFLLCYAMSCQARLRSWYFSHVLFVCLIICVCIWFLRLEFNYCYYHHV